MLNIEPIYVYVPVALALHAFVAWHVWHARREAQDAMEYVMGSGYYEGRGLSEDIITLVNERVAGGAVGAAGDLITPLFRHLGEKVNSALKETSTPPQHAEKEGASQANDSLPKSG